MYRYHKIQYTICQYIYVGGHNWYIADLLAPVIIWLRPLSQGLPGC